MADPIGMFDADLRLAAWFDPALVSVGWFNYGLPFEHEFITPAATGAYTLSAATGVFVITGNAATLKEAHTLGATTGVFVITGNAAGLVHGYTLSASTGVFTITGNVAGLHATRLVTAAAGSFVITGQAAGLLTARILSAGTGVFTLSGSAAALQVGRRLSASTGTFAINGTAAALQVGRRLSASTGSFVFSGTAAGLFLGRRLVCSPGSFVETGNDATLSQGGGLNHYILTCFPGSFAIAGNPADLVYRPAGFVIYSGFKPLPETQKSNYRPPRIDSTDRENWDRLRRELMPSPSPSLAAKYRGKVKTGHFGVTGNPANLLVNRKMSSAAIRQPRRNHYMKAETGRFDISGLGEDQAAQVLRDDDELIEALTGGVQ